MLAALRAEVFKTTHRRMSYILLGAVAALVGLYYVLLWLQIEAGPGHRRRSLVHWLALKDGMSFSNSVPYALELERFFVTLVCVVFVATMMGNEYDWRTAGQAVSRGVKRHHFIAAKPAVGVVFTVIAVLVGFAVALGLSAWFSHVYALPFGQMDVDRGLGAAAGLARTIYVVLPFVAMSLFVAALSRSAGQAVGFSVGFFFLESIFTGVLSDAQGLLSHVPAVLVNANIFAVMQSNGAVPAGSLSGPFGVLGLTVGSSAVPIWRGALVLFLWTALLSGVALWRFVRRDLRG